MLIHLFRLQQKDTARFVYQEKTKTVEQTAQAPNQKIKEELQSLMQAVENPESAREELTDFQAIVSEYLINNAPDLTKESQQKLSTHMLKEAISETLAQYLTGNESATTQELTQEYEKALENINKNLTRNLEEWETGIEVSFSDLEGELSTIAMGPISTMEAYKKIIHIQPEDYEKQSRFTQDLIQERASLVKKAIVRARHDFLRFDTDGDFSFSLQEVEAFKAEVKKQAQILTEGQTIDDVDDNGSVDTVLPTQLVRNISSVDENLKAEQENFKIAAGSMFPPQWCTQGTELGPIAFATPEDEKTVGMGEMFPASVRVVTVIKANGSVITGATRKGLAGGFYANGKYVPVFDGDKIKITQSNEKAEQERRQAYQKEYARNTKNETTGETTTHELTQDLFVQTVDTKETQKINIADEKVDETNAVYQMAMRHGIDPFLFLALQTQKQPEARQNFTELYLTARSIKKLMVSLEDQGEKIYEQDAFGNKIPAPNFLAMLAAHGVKGLPAIDAQQLMTAYQDVSKLSYSSKQKAELKKAKRTYAPRATSRDKTDYRLTNDPKGGFPRFKKAASYSPETFTDHFEFNYEAMPKLKAQLIRSILSLVSEGRLRLKYTPRDIARLPLINTKTLQVLAYIGENSHRYPGVSISSMLRSQKHNDSLSASAKKSWHRCGSGMDIAGMNYDKYKQLESELKREFKSKYPNFDSTVHAKRDDHGNPIRNHPNLHLHVEFEEQQSYGVFQNDREIDKHLTKFVRKKGSKQEHGHEHNDLDTHGHGHAHGSNYEKLTPKARGREDEYYRQDPENKDNEPYNEYYRPAYKGLDFRYNLDDMKKACDIQRNSSGVAILIAKEENRAYIYKDGKVVDMFITGTGRDDYKNFDKTREGDHTTPLGMFTLTVENHKKFGYAARLDYPTDLQKERAKSDGIKKPGGGILLHRAGVGEKQLQKMETEGKDYSEGCVYFKPEDRAKIQQYLGNVGGATSQIVIIPRLPNGVDPATEI